MSSRRWRSYITIAAGMVIPGSSRHFDPGRAQIALNRTLVSLLHEGKRPEIQSLAFGKDDRKPGLLPDSGQARHSEAVLCAMKILPAL